MKAMLSDFESIALKANEIANLLKKHLDEKNVITGVDLSVLSDREREVFDLIGKRIKAKDIAKQLGISSKTCYEHRYRIREKLKLESTFELEKVAQDMSKEG